MKERGFLFWQKPLKRDTIISDMICSKIQSEYNDIKALAKEYRAAFESHDRDRTKELKAILERKRSAFEQTLWPFDRTIYSREKLREHYNQARECYREQGLLTVLSQGQEGI